MARCGCRDKYINKDAVLLHQLHNDQLIAQLDTLRSQLYIALGSPFQLLSTQDDNGDGYLWGGYIIWQEYQQAELIGYQSFTIPLNYQINIYKKVLDKLSNGVIQLKLPIDNVILVDFVKKKRVRSKKNNVVQLQDVVQLRLMLGA